jgi:hypothetical protein
MQNPTRMNVAAIVATSPADAPLLTWEQITAAVTETWAPAHAYLVPLVDQANRAAMREWIMGESACETGAQDSLHAVINSGVFCADHTARLDAGGWRRVISSFIEACDVYAAEAYPLLDEDLHSKMEWDLYQENMTRCVNDEIGRREWPASVTDGGRFEAIIDRYNAINSSGETFYAAPGDPCPSSRILTEAVDEIHAEEWDDAVDLTYHGVERHDTFLGAGTAFTEYTHVQVGTGSTPRAALQEAIDDCDAPDAARDAMQRQLDAHFTTPWARMEPQAITEQDEDGELYCYASVRWAEV